MNRSNKQSEVVEMYFLLITDIICLLFSYVCALYLRFHSVRRIDEPQLHWTVFLGILIFVLLYNSAVDYNRDFTKRGYYVEFMAISKRNFIIALGMGFILFAVKEAGNYSRLVFGYFVVIDEVVTYGAHIAVKQYLRNSLSKERNKVKIMVVTDSRNAQELLQNLVQKAELSWDITSVAILDRASDASSCVYSFSGQRMITFDEKDNSERVSAKAWESILQAKTSGNWNLTAKEREDIIPVVANKENLVDIARQMPIDECFICLSEENKTDIGHLIKDFETMGVVCHYNIDVDGLGNMHSMVEEFGGFTVITYAENQIDYRRRMIKRLMDIVGSLIGLCITLITFPFVAIAIKIDSPGPVFFAQTRIGKNGRRFKIYKYRSMYVDAEKRKKELEAENEVQGLMFKMENDPRITRVGRFIRKTSIDELPQFYNILIGDMSLVGTRPPTEDEFENYTPYYKRRLCMTPGLTGMWQVSGRSNVEDFDEVVKLDLHYIDHWSLSLDFKILIQTVGVVLFGKGAK